jgi:hypothetical protein
MTAAVLTAWHEIVATRNASRLAALLADDVVFHSPVVHTPQAGRQVTVLYLSAALRVFCNDTFRYVREIEGPRDAALEFRVDIDGVLVNGVDLISWNEAGQIVEFKVMLRPLRAVNLIHEKMAAMMQSQR